MIGYRGWHAVCDHLHILLAVSYERISGTLGVKFNTGNPALYGPVPERIYQILLTNKFAGAYFRKHVKGKYPILYQDLPQKHKPTEQPNDKHLTVPMPAAQGSLFL